MSIEQYPKKTILIVDDEVDILYTYKKILRNNGINNLILCEDSRKVMDILSENSISLILLDLFMPNISGKELMEKIKIEYPDIPIIVITGSNNLETAVECMKLGSTDYIVKPVEKSRFLSSIRNTLEILELKNEVSTLKSEVLSESLSNPDNFSNIITINKKMYSIFKYIEAISHTAKPVLITGESGVGKELIANVIHKLSGRKGNFVPVNVAGLDDNMFSDTLFGHKKGAFTGAGEARNGLIEQADGGTLFLDEIGDLEMTSQVKLLRLLQEHEYYKIGSDVVRQSYARIITATSLDLKEILESGKFRKELYFRLITHHIEIPPLRDRMEDLPFLIEHLVDISCKNLEKDKIKIPIEVNNLLLTYNFPGNIRELEAVIFDAVSVSKSDIINIDFIKEYLDKHQENKLDVKKELEDKVIRIVTSTGKLPTLKQVEEYLFTEALKQCNGNQSAAAQILDVSQPTLSRFFKKKNE